MAEQVFDTLTLFTVEAHTPAPKPYAVADAHYLSLNIGYDQDAECPSDNRDSTWRVVSFSSRHSKYENPDNYLTPVYDERGRFQYADPNNIGLRRKIQCGTAFILSYYEHGQGQWSIKGEGTQCRWDTADVAGIAFFDSDPSEISRANGLPMSEKYNARAADLRGFLEEYNNWANGYVYGYSFSYDGDDPDNDETDSCWGFYDPKYLLSDGITPTVKNYMKEHGLTELVTLSEDEFDSEQERIADDDEYEPSYAADFTLYLTVKGAACGKRGSGAPHFWGRMGLSVPGRNDNDYHRNRD
jgi:hypothetical protein